MIIFMVFLLIVVFNRFFESVTFLAINQIHTLLTFVVFSLHSIVLTNTTFLFRSFIFYNWLNYYLHRMLILMLILLFNVNRIKITPLTKSIPITFLTTKTNPNNRRLFTNLTKTGYMSRKIF